MSEGMFNINKKYAENALDKRSMFARDFTLLLMYFALHGQEIPDELKSAQEAIGTASFKDLTLRLPKYLAQKDIKESGAYLLAALAELHFSFFHLFNSMTSIVQAFYRLAGFLLTLVGNLILFPVNMAYGALDWLGLQGALTYFKHSRHEKFTERLNRASFVSLAISFITLPVRLAFGLVEALQEPLHLYDFWVKGAVDAYHERQNHEISRPVYAAKLFLHAFKVVCTLGAVLSIVGITAIPFISKGFDYLGKIAYAFIGTKELIPYHRYIFDMPLKGLQQTLVGVESGIKQVTGIHYSHMSQHTNAHDAIKLGFESSLTKGAALLPMEKGYRPVDIRPTRS